MIRELFTFISERPKLTEARAFGHLVESISLLSREARCKNAWKPHRTECKNFITDNISSALHNESVLVLGSGPLHEIPIEVLSKKFKKVVLVDVVHLKSTKKAISHLTNIEFVEHDVSELEMSLLREEKLINKLPQRFLDQNFGLTLSVNIMSQLPIHLEAYIEKKLSKKFTKNEIEEFLKATTRDHLSYLMSFKCPALLITDVRTHYLDPKEALIQTDENYLHLSMPKASHSWKWNIAPIPEFQKDIAIKMDVDAFVLKNSK